MSKEVYKKILLILIKQFSSVTKYMDWSGTIIGESYFLFMDFKTFLTARIWFYYLLFDDKNIATVMNWWRCEQLYSLLLLSYYYLTILVIIITIIIIIIIIIRSQPYAFSIDGSSGELLAAGQTETDSQAWMFDIRYYIPWPVYTRVL